MCNCFSVKAYWIQCRTLKKKYISLICDKIVTTHNLAFLSYWYRKKRLQMQSDKYSVTTQFAKLAAGEQLCRRCTNSKL